jgi:hypothetical protein
MPRRLRRPNPAFQTSDACRALFARLRQQDRPWKAVHARVAAARHAPTAALDLALLEELAGCVYASPRLLTRADFVGWRRESVIAWAVRTILESPPSESSGWNWTGDLPGRAAFVIGAMAEAGQVRADHPALEPLWALIPALVAGDARAHLAPLAARLAATFPDVRPDLLALTPRLPGVTRSYLYNIFGHPQITPAFWLALIVEADAEPIASLLGPLSERPSAVVVPMVAAALWTRGLATADTYEGWNLLRHVLVETPAGGELAARWEAFAALSRDALGVSAYGTRDDDRDERFEALSPAQRASLPPAAVTAMLRSPHGPVRQAALVAMGTQAARSA